MNVSIQRIRRLALLFALGLVLVGLHLAYVMVAQHETWLGRSYKNRWAFRDVPSRRGQLADRHGRQLAVDTPCSSLELHYWAFRRYHPVGAAVEGANLAIPAAGKLTYRDAARAFRILIETGVHRLRKDVSDDCLARDLQFYLSSLLSSLTNASHGKIRVRLRRAATDGSHEPAYRVLKLDRQELLALFKARLAELSELDSRLQAGRAGLPSIWGLLDRGLQNRRLLVEFGKLNKAEQKRRRRAWRSYYKELRRWQQLPRWKRQKQEGQRCIAPRPPEPAEPVPSSEHQLRNVGDQLPYEVALYLASIRERHPGLVVHPSVRRVRSTLPGRTDLASLEPLIGRVARAFSHRDQEERDLLLLEQQLDRMAVELDQLPAGDAELSDRLQQQARDRARKVVESDLRGRGRVGTSGAELDLDPVLRGDPGLRFVERSRGVSQRRLWGSFDVSPGQDLRLTFDLRLQVVLEQAMDEVLAVLPEAQVAAMAVIDPHSGDVLALASRPLDGGLPAAVTWRSAGDIGSVGKPFVLLEHLDAMRHGRPHAPHEHFRDCVGTYRPGLGCDHSHFAQARDPVEALGASCNFFYYQAAEGLSGAGVLDAYRRFGLAPDVPADPGASSPQTSQVRFQGRHQQSIQGLWLRNRVKQDHRIPQRWAIGYGIEANVLSMARGYAGLATGKLPQLSFVCGQNRPAPVHLGLHPDDMRVMRDGLEHCVREGTAHREQALLEFGVLAKTGTATVGEPDSKVNNAWLAGYLTRERPTLVFAAVVYRVEGYGASQAGPLVTAFLQMLRKDLELREAYL